MASDKEFEGNTLDEAIGAAAKRLGVEEDDLDFHILETGRKGILGLGQRNVKISVSLPEMAQAPVAPRGPRGGRSDGRGRGGRSQGDGNARQGSAAKTDGGAGVPAGVDGSELVPAARKEGDRPRRRRRRRSKGSGDGQPLPQPQSQGAPPRGENEAQDGRPKRRRRRRRGGRRRGGGEGAPRRDARPQGPPAAEMHENPQRLQVEESVREMIENMGYTWTIESKGIDGGVRIDLGGDDIDALTTNDADLLLSMQFLLNRMARRTWPEIPRIVLSCDGHRSKRDEEIVELAKEVADQVRNTGQAKKLHEMNPYERRLVHVLIQDYDDLETASVGRGFLKQVRIEPTAKPVETEPMEEPVADVD